MGNPMLRTFDDPILAIASEGLAPDDDLAFLDDLRQLMKDHPAAGVLTGPQVGVGRSATILWPDRGQLPIVMLNPVILSRDAQVNTQVETCLSYPGASFPVDRKVGVTCRYFDEDWNLRERRFIEPLSRLIQHAVEHLQGKCAIGDAWRLEKSVK